MQRLLSLAIPASVLLCFCVATQAVAAEANEYFAVRVVDDQTGRGVPLVELRLPHEVSYWTDSAGVVAMNEPTLVGREVFAVIKSHGYEYPAKSLMGRGTMLKIEPGTVKEIRIQRTMIAERLYRLTGEGIYRDSQLAGLPVKSKKPMLGNARVLGQDTISAALYRDRIFWIWGDTIGPDYWNFSVTAATSELNIDPAVDVEYEYFVDKNGNAKKMLPLAGKGLVWIEGLITVTDPEGKERLIATYTRQDGLKRPDESGLALFNDELQVFEPWIRTKPKRSHVSSHPFLHDGYWYLYPGLRVPNDWHAIQDPARWEQRDVQLPDCNAKPSCVVWNEYRRRWILLLEHVGDVFYAEAEHPEGPYGPAIRIIEHDNYNFYNVATHSFFNQDGGRTIYLEGTYTDAFSGAKEKTPRYNYNQVMYRLRLDDKQLAAAKE